MRNPFAQAEQPLQITVEADKAILDVAELLVEDRAWAITRPIDAVVPHMVLLVGEEMREEILALVMAAEPTTAPRRVREMKLTEIDWVSKVQKDFPPFTMGPFYVYGSHAQQAIPQNTFPLLIDAAAAFGTGEHATTAGCLLALANEKKTRPHLTAVADIGCGTAILAIGAARLWQRARVDACDYDPVAVRVSAHNLKVNRVGSRTRAFHSDGYKMRPLRGKTYPVVVANILAKPLMKMARDAVQHVAPGGTLILSGLLNEQENMVLAAHQAQGMYLKRRLRRGNWSILVLAR